MFKRYEDELQWLQEELIAAEEDEYEEICEEYGEDEEFPGEESWEEEACEDEEDDMDDAVRMVSHRYGRGSPKRFEDQDFFEDDVEEDEILYKKDYKKAKRKKARQNFGLVILAILEILGIAAVLLWWASWAV